jgi:hypothetical protein
MSTKARSLFRTVAFGVLLALLVGVPLLFLLMRAVQALWNWLMPGIFGLRAITYWEAWGLFLLAHLLFGGAAFRHHTHSRDGSFRRRVTERFAPGSPAPADDAASAG